jgi:large subunit ribosomal protein L18
MLGNHRVVARIRRQKRVRKQVRGTDERPRICVYRSDKHIYAQVISDDKGVTLVSVSTLSPALKGKTKSSKGIPAAKAVGQALAEACKEKKITNVIFDRNGFLYHGRVKALADALREAGLKF